VEHPTAQAAVDALELAVAARHGEYLGELEIRSDGGPQFTAHRYAAAVARLGLRHTVTPARSPDHNPFAEAFIGAFKEECVYQSHWTSPEQAITDVEAWIHKYRRCREQAALGGLAPLEYRAVRLQQLAA
jgi:transposase InsO family protein